MLTAVLISAGMTTSVFAGETTELHVYAAASMTETLTEIGSMYQEENPDIKVIFTFDSSL